MYRPGDREAPYRALAVLTNVARGHAVVHGRDGVTVSDMPLIARVTASSMPGDSARLFKGLVRAGTLSVEAAQTLLGASHPETARDRMRYMHALGVAEFHERGTGKAAELCFTPEWEWCASSEFRTLLLDEPVTGPGMCGAGEPVTDSEVCLSPATKSLV
jgi:hypothetical protein